MCRTSAFGECATLRISSTTRIINHLFDIETDFEFTDFFIIPGGRYLVCSSPTNIAVLDLGYTSSADCKLVDSTVPEGGNNDFIVHTTPDGMGLIIYSSNE